MEEISSFEKTKCTIQGNRKEYKLKLYGFYRSKAVKRPLKSLRGINPLLRPIEDLKNEKTADFRPENVQNLGIENRLFYFQIIRKGVMPSAKNE